MCIMLAVFMGKVLKKKTAVAGDEVTYSLMLRQMQKAAAIQQAGMHTVWMALIITVEYVMKT